MQSDAAVDADHDEVLVLPAAHLGLPPRLEGRALSDAARARTEDEQGVEKGSAGSQTICARVASPPELNLLGLVGGGGVDLDKPRLVVVLGKGYGDIMSVPYKGLVDLRLEHKRTAAES